jgi:hypothetical protein
MIELCYDSDSLALFIVSRKMGSRRAMEFLEQVYTEEKSFLYPDYKEDKKRLFSDTLYWMEYLIDKETLDAEFPAVRKDFKATGHKFVEEAMMSDYPEFDLYFMFLRLRIKYSNSQDYIRMKLRTLLGHYGYKRRSQALVEHIRDCMMFYHIQSYLRGNVLCDIREIELDDMITFRVLW